MKEEYERECRRGEGRKTKKEHYKDSEAGTGREGKGRSGDKVKRRKEQEEEREGRERERMTTGIAKGERKAEEVSGEVVWGGGREREDGEEGKRKERMSVWAESWRKGGVWSM